MTQTKFNITSTPKAEANATVATLRDLNRIGTTAVPHNALHGVNMGHDTLLLAVPMHKFFNMSEVANAKTVRALAENGQEVEITQRPLDTVHAARLGTYILKGLTHATIEYKRSNGEEISPELVHIQKTLGAQPYIALQPIVANLNAKPEELTIETTKAGVLTVYLADRHVLWVVDGQHRRYGMQLAFEFLRHVRDNRTYPKRSKVYAWSAETTLAEVKAWSEIFEIGREYCNIAVEVHIGLSDDAERQLFHDLNNLGKKVEASLSFEFDHSNPVNRFIKDELELADFFKPAVVTKDIVNWAEDTGVISRKDLMAVNAQLLLNKTNVSGAQPVDVSEKSELAMKFWETVNLVKHFGEAGAKQKTVSAQPVMLKALAKLFHNFAWGKQRNEEHLQILLDGIQSKIDFSHENPMWRYYELTPEEVAAAGLTDMKTYLPSDTEGANRDLGKFDPNDRVMRFGAKHNDIFPILGDMIRWQLSLPSRHTKESGE